MSEDKGGKKLPVRYHKTETAPTAVDRVHAPVSNQTLLGRFVSGFVARLNRHTIERNTEEVRAHTEYAKARGEYAETCTEAERKIEHYLQHRDDIIADDTNSISTRWRLTAPRAHWRARSANTK